MIRHINRPSTIRFEWQTLRLSNPETGKKNIPTAQSGQHQIQQKVPNKSGDKSGAASFKFIIPIRNINGVLTHVSITYMNSFLATTSMMGYQSSSESKKMLVAPDTGMELVGFDENL